MRLVAGIQTSARARPLTMKRIISNNSYAYDEQEDNAGQEKEGSTVSCINCDRC